MSNVCFARFVLQEEVSTGPGFGVGVETPAGSPPFGSPLPLSSDTWERMMQVTYRVLLATVCIVGGCIVLVAFGNHESADYGVQDMIDLYTRTQYVVYLVILMVMMVLCYLTYRGTKKAVQEQRVGSKRARYGNTLLPMLYSIFSAMVCAPCPP